MNWDIDFLVVYGEKVERKLIFISYFKETLWELVIAQSVLVCVGLPRHKMVTTYSLHLTSSSLSPHLCYTRHREESFSLVSNFSGDVTEHAVL